MAAAWVKLSIWLKYKRSTFEYWSKYPGLYPDIGALGKLGAFGARKGALYDIICVRLVLYQYVDNPFAKQHLTQ